MSCCPTAPEITVGGWTGDDEEIAPSAEIGEGESVECYMRRVGNATNRLDDKTEPVPDTIENTDIPLVKGTDVSVQFRLTVNSTQTATSWSYVSDPPLPVGVQFVGDRLSGSFPPESYGKKFKLTVTAEPAISTRAFAFSPAVATGSNEIAFTHPLPGATVTSAFGYRKAPLTGASTKHQGVDLARGVSTDVLAAADGIVTFAAPKGKGGNTIIIQHLNADRKALCTTHYMHLAKILVSRDQVVVAGQKIGVEGTTGNSTGVHLHFECRLPNNDAIEPTQFIKGSMKAARRANPDGTADKSTVETVTNNGVLTPENAAAKQSACPEPGPTYPKPKGLTNDAIPPGPPGDPFEKAWFFTMFSEVGPHWTSDSQNDPDVIAGAIDTESQRHKVGFVAKPGFRGGVTKFGIAENYNKDLAPVAKITYDTAKNRGYNGYWKGAPKSLADAGKPKTAVMLFDINYLHGPGNGNKMRKDANVDNLSDDDAVVALSAAQLKFMHSIAGNQEYSGWFSRNSNLLKYVKGLS